MVFRHRSTLLRAIHAPPPHYLETRLTKIDSVHYVKVTILVTTECVSGITLCLNCTLLSGKLQLHFNHLFKIEWLRNSDRYDALSQNSNLINRLRVWSVFRK